MEETVAPSEVGMYITGGVLVVPIQTELSDELMPQIQMQLLEKVNDTGVKGVIIDVSRVNIIDSFIAQAICETARMASVLGATAILTGLKPGVVASLIDLDFELKDIQTAVTLEEGFQRLESLLRVEEEPEEIEEPEEERPEDQQEQAAEDEGSMAEEAEEEPLEGEPDDRS